MSHELRMLLGCLVPLALLFILPLFGVSDGVARLIFLVGMFACHLTMIGGGKHSHGSSHSQGAPQ